MGVTKTKWEEESRKRVESALKEQEAIWQKRYLQAIWKTFHLSTTLVLKDFFSKSNEVSSVLNSALNTA